MKNNLYLRSTLTLISIIVIVASLIFQENVVLAAETEGYQSPLNQFTIGGVNFTAYAIAPLEWEGTGQTNISVFINATVIPAQANLTIISVSFYYQKINKPNREFADITVVNTTLTNQNRTLDVIKPLYPPSDVDKFNITIDITAKTDTVSDQDFYMEFPGDYPYINVKREKVIPIINLPGFPNSESFIRWIIIFGFSTILLALPSIFVGSKKIGEWIEKRKKSKGRN